MRLTRQTAAIAATVAAIVGGSAGAWAISSSGSDKPAAPVVQVADVPTDSASPTDTATPTATASASPSATASAADTPTASPTPTSTKAGSVSTPTSDPTPTSAATAGQNNGGSGTVDNGPYPSHIPGGGPSGDPNKGANTPPSPSAPASSPEPTAT